MRAAGSYRDLSRRKLQESLLDAARDLAVARGWNGVRMIDVAAAVGVSRQTVYNEFHNKPGLAEALLTREIDRFVGAVRDRLFQHGSDIRSAGQAAIRQTLTEAEDNPLVKAILAGPGGGTDNLLPYLTTRSELVHAAAGAVIRDWASTYLTDVAETTVAEAAESIVRLVVSHIVRPSASADLTAAALAEVLVRLLAETNSDVIAHPRNSTAQHVTLAHSRNLHP